MFYKVSSVIIIPEEIFVEDKVILFHEESLSSTQKATIKQIMRV